MSRLTERRLEKARPILEKYREDYLCNGRIETGQFENELRACWNMGYQELKDLIEDMLKIPQYRRIAAYYMQFSNPPGPVSEFKPHLAKLYGLETYDCKERHAARDAYWAEPNS